MQSGVPVLGPIVPISSRRRRVADQPIKRPRVVSGPSSPPSGLLDIRALASGEGLSGSTQSLAGPEFLDGLELPRFVGTSLVDVSVHRRKSQSVPEVEVAPVATSWHRRVLVMMLVVLVAILVGLLLVAL